ncbi:MAG: hypothetical protein LUE27_05505 [Clostridia bacterium]|nr:hypothetical protein [Clostridia bacterium]
MRRLIAKRAVLYQSHLYAVGDELPVGDPRMIRAWVDAKSAYWKDDENKLERPVVAEAVKATLATAEPGLAGSSPDSETADNLVGKVPETPARATGGKAHGKKNVQAGSGK